jgi:hypothetical protein
LLGDDPEAQLFVLTPDPVRPAWFDGFDSTIEAGVASRIIWLSFRQLGATIEEIAADPSRLLGEQTRFLLSELVQLFETDGLLTSDDTVIVAARAAWPFCLQSGAYVCQPNRAFREGLTHLGFYAEAAIQPLIPVSTRTAQRSYSLSSAQSDETVKLNSPIANDNQTATGKPWAWTLGQRYTRLERLRSGVRFTSQL